MSNQIQAYQFIKYDNNTTIEHLNIINDSGAILCFDFEDCIVNPLDFSKTSYLKDIARKNFSTLYTLIKKSTKEFKIGIRINNVNSIEFEKDLQSIRNMNFEIILLPKVETDIEILYAKSKLNEFEINYKQLIPLIESKQSLVNLSEILSEKLNITKIAFGHCDYNFDINAYPFFHQDSWEFWKWISEFSRKLENKAIQLINSPFLNAENEIFFCAMLDYLKSKKHLFCGQFTLTTRQSTLCKHRILTEISISEFLENKNLVSTNKGFALELINTFEANNIQRGLTKIDNKFISLQEYLSSKNLIKDQKINYEFCFVGGCFPVQHNILYEDLFHQHLKRKVQNNYKCNLNINIIRYERLKDIFTKINELSYSKKIDILVLHIRPEPYLRLVKLLYKYQDSKGRIKYSFNLPFFNHLIPEKYNVLDNSDNSFDVINKDKSIFHQLLITFNYLLGSIIGNKFFALRKYYKITNEVINHCNSKNQCVIILGPNRRNNNQIEPFLCNNLNSYFSKRIKNENYIDGYIYDGATKLNQKNGIHVTHHYHELIAEKLYFQLQNLNFFNGSK